MTTKKLLAAAGVALGIAAIATTPARSEGFDFSGKQVQISIGFGFGGTYGQYSQLFADHLKDLIPGNPTVIVDSRPGAGGMRMTNYAGVAMPADGYHYLVPPDSSVLVQLLAPKKAKFDMSKFSWIGTANQTNVIVVVRSDTGVTKWQDLLDKQVLMGSTGLGSTAYIIPNLINGLLNTKMKVVSGYKGSSKTGLSVEQGETNGAAFNWLFWKSKYERWFQGEKPFARAIMQVGYFEDPDLPSTVPMLKNLVDAKDKQLVDFVGALGLIGRGLAAPPGTPQAAIDVMKTAWNKMIKDPNFIADVKKRNLRVQPASADDVEKAVRNAIATAKANPQLVKRASELVYGKK